MICTVGRRSLQADFAAARRWREYAVGAAADAPQGLLAMSKKGHPVPFSQDRRRDKAALMDSWRNGLRLGNRLFAVVVAVSVAACSATPQPKVGPPALGLSGEDTYATYIARLPLQFKMRQHVESRFGERNEVIDGFFVVKRPERFWLQARGMLGIRLFEVRELPDKPRHVEIYLDQLRQAGATAESSMPAYLARDIRRIYLTDCPVGTPVTDSGQVFVVDCVPPHPEPAPGPTAPTASGDEPDDRLVMVLNKGAALSSKHFYRDGALRVTISYEDLRPVGATWLAHTIRLVHAALPYALRIVLIDVDLGFDAGAVFARFEQ